MSANASSQSIAITGVNGFVGRHLAKELLEHGSEVVGTSLNTLHPSLKGVVAEYRAADLSKQWPKLDNVKVVVHLAGLASVGDSFDRPQEYIETNSALLTNMCEYYLKQKTSPRLIIVSSGAVYDPRAAMPLKEGSPVGCASPYVVSKILLENQAAYYRSRGLDCVVVRPFNHIGPGQSAGFLIPDLLDQLTGPGDALKVGNLNTKRDYTDVRDVARAYRLLATAATLNNDIYNVCSGNAVAGNEVLSLLQQLTDISKPIEVDEDKIRPSDAEVIYGSFERLQADTGWLPEIPLEQTIRDILADTK
jgi:GDP-4-dehydro-6-deoxy-D-mannose reductase